MWLSGAMVIANVMRIELFVCAQPGSVCTRLERNKAQFAALCN